MEIDKSVVIITGGAGSIGRVFVRDLLILKAIVCVIDINLQLLQSLKLEHPEVHIYECDVTDFNAMREVIKLISDEFERIDVLINNSGIIHSEPLVSFSDSGLKIHTVEAWSNVLNNNLNSVFYASALVAERMISKRTKGLIINISSISAAGIAGQTAYSASKAAVNALSYTWSKELGVFGIRAVSIAPGFLDTDSTRKALSANAIKEITAKVPLRKMGSPDHISQMVISVIQNDYINGAVLAVDGGLTI